MKYIIMCGTGHEGWNTPRQLFEVGNETIVARTIRLLGENGIEDIAISSNNPIFNAFGVPVLHHKNEGMWMNGFYPTKEPACYLFGDVVFSKAAMKAIVETKTDDVEFFASAPPFAENYYKAYAEPFAFKVQDQKHFRKAINKTKRLARSKKFRRDPIAWELWQVIKNTELNKIDYTNYTVINDFTCDVDWIPEAKIFMQWERNGMFKE